MKTWQLSFYESPWFCLLETKDDSSGNFRGVVFLDVLRTGLFCTSSPLVFVTGGGGIISPNADFSWRESIIESIAASLQLILTCDKILNNLILIKRLVNHIWKNSLFKTNDIAIQEVFYISEDTVP